MRVSTRVVRKKTETNASLEVLSLEAHPPSPSPSPKVPTPSRAMPGPQLQLLTPEAGTGSAASTPQSLSSSLKARSSRVVPGPRKVSSAPPASLPVSSLSATYPSAAPALDPDRRVNSAGGSPAAAFGRRHAGRGIQEAKEFCVDMGTDVGVVLEGPAEDDDSDSVDADDAPFDAQEREDFDEASLADDPVTAAKPEEATPRLTAYDICTIQDPATLDFLAKNRTTLARYISLDQSVGSRASTPVACGVERDWTFFLTRTRKGSAAAAASPTASEALSLSSVRTPAWVPVTPAAAPSGAVAEAAVSPRLSPDPFLFGDLPSPVVGNGEPDDLGWSIGGLSIGSSEGAEDTSSSPLDGELEEIPPSTGGSHLTSPTESTPSLPGDAPRSFFGKATGPGTKPRRKGRSPGSDTTSSTRTTADTPHYRLTEEEERKVKAILDDKRFNTEEYALVDGEGYSLAATEEAALRQLDEQLAALRRARGCADVGEDAVRPADPPLGPAPRVLLLEAVERDRDAVAQAGKEKANQFLLESRAERVRGSQLSTIHQRLEALYEAEAYVSERDVHLPADVLQRLLQEATRPPPATSPMPPPAGGPPPLEVAEPTGFEWEAEQRQPPTGLPEEMGQCAEIPPVDESEDEEEAALTRRIAAARARLTQRLVPAFDEAVFWEERAEWADDDPASLGDGADGRADPGSTVPRDA